MISRARHQTSPQTVNRTSLGHGRVVTSRLSVREQLQAVASYRELLVGLVRKELKVRYRGSALGFLWSLLNPALSLAVFYVVFEILLNSGIPSFPIFLLSGLLAWNLLSGALAGATGSVVANAGLVNKVYFPRLILPVASVGAAIVHFFLQAIVLVAVLVATSYDIALGWVWLLVPAFVGLVLLSGCLSVLLSAVNVYARDTQHFLELVLLAWMWLTPIVYPYQLVAERLAERDLPSWLPLLNPMTSVTLVFQRVLHNRVDGEGGVSDRPGLAGVTVNQILPDESMWWYLRNVSVLIVVSTAVLLVAIHVFSRLEGNFAEEL